MAGLETAVAAKIVSQPLIDLYEKGKDRFDAELQKWRNSAARKSLTQKVITAQKVKTFWQRDKEVNLSSFYYPSRIKFDGEVTKVADSLSDLPRIGNYVIQGTVGQGKSIFLRYMCIQELRDIGTGRIPILIELRTVTSSGLKSSIFSALDRLGFIINDDLYDYYLESNNLVLLLDAFDELDESLIKETICYLENISEKYSSLQIFITSRPNSSIQESRHFRVIQLAPLATQDHEPFIKRIGVAKTDVTRLLEAISESSAAVSNLLTTPLMLTLFVIVYRAEHSIPRELPDFFDSLFQTLFTKHDKSKPGFVRTQKAGMGERALQHLFQAFCFSVIQQRQQTTLTNEAFHAAFDQALKYLDIKCDPEAFKYDVTKVACLMQEEGFLLHFIHKSVLEFYAASFVRSLTEELAHRFYSKVNGGIRSFRWHQVLQFLSKIDMYRYTRYYAIPTLTLELKFIGLEQPFDHKNIHSNIEENLLKNVEVGFTRTSDGAYNQSLVGSFSTSAFMQESHMLLSPDSASSIYSASFSSRDELLKIFPSASNKKNDLSRTIEKEILFVPWRDCISEKELNIVKEKALAMVKNYINKLRRFEKYVENENRKVDLLTFD